jgi:hypothetical protein
VTRSRRGILTACGVGLTALAGCSSLGVGDDSPTYDTDRIVVLGRRDVPRPPTTFPVSVSDATRTQHLDRARKLVERVPERPNLPNGVVVERLRQERESVVERLDEQGSETNSPTNDPLVRLREARSVRGDAAAVEAAYRAAIDAIAPRAVADRRAQLRSDLLAFERDWTYRGDDSAIAAVVHRELEAIRLDARSGIAPDRAFPDAPPTDVFRAGEVVRSLEVGRAALSDAERLRARYRDGLSDPRAYRSVLSVAASRLRRICQRYFRELEAYTDPGPEALPFDRSIEGTPLERLYVRAVDGVEIFRTDAEAARHRGDHATALIETGISLTVLRALESVVADIRRDRISVPDTVGGIAAVRREAIGALERAWSTSPTALAAAVARWSWLLLDDATDRLQGPAHGPNETPDANDVHRVWAIYVTAARTAAAVPRTVADVRAGLGTDTA